MAGRLEVYCGSMFAGKSTELQRQGRRLELAGLKVVYLKPDIDKREGAAISGTHDGSSVYAIPIPIPEKRTDPIYNIVRHPAVEAADVICIDEIQFFPLQAFLRQIMYMIAHGKIILVAGLDLDKKSQPFAMTRELMARAEVVKKLTAVCAGCGSDAYVSVETKENKSRINVGNDYIPLCRSCAYEKWRQM